MRLVIIGDGGHAKVAKEVAASHQFEIAAVVDDKYNYEQMDDIIYCHSQYLSSFSHEAYCFFIAIGNNEIRKKMAELPALAGAKFATLLSPRAVISTSAVIAPGTLVMPAAVINADAVIDRHAIINTGSVVEHDVRIGAYSHVSPNATLTGGVQVGEGVHIGAGAVVNPLMAIGDRSVIGSGAVVTRSIPAGVVAKGVPAKFNF